MSVRATTLDERLRTSADRESPLATEEYFVNMGPQHPSTHGVLRVLLKLDGETVREVIPVLGYVHRGIEKMGEHLTYRQFIPLSDRLDYLSAIANNWAVALAVERAANIEVTDRVQTIRTILAELQRLQSHQLWWGVFGMDLGAFTPFLYGFRDREVVTDILEETTGARLTLNYVQPGGLMVDIPPSFASRVKEFLAYFRPKLDEYDELLGGNAIVQLRLRNIGILDAASAVSLGATGPILRASGVGYDLRRREPYGAYARTAFDIPLGTTGDCWDRYAVRIAEMRQSMRIIEQLIDSIPEGKTMVLKPSAPIRIPEGFYYSHLETARGVLGVTIVSDGGPRPYRIHLRTPNFNNLWCVTRIAPGHRIADLVAILSTLDIVVPDADR